MKNSRIYLLLVLSLCMAIALSFSVTAVITSCWSYTGNQTGCEAQGGKCSWKSKTTNPWCINDSGCCDSVSCWNYDGNKTGCEAASTAGLSCAWQANDKNQDPWCPIKKIGDWAPAGQITTEANIGCCEMTGCWNRDNTNQTYCEAPDFLNGVCQWHNSFFGSGGFCNVAPCDKFNGNETRCKSAESMGFPCNWNSAASTCGGSVGCGSYNNQSQKCFDNGCSYTPSTGLCAPPGLDFVGEGGGTDHCWFADNNPAACMNISGCVYCTGDNAEIARQLGGGNISSPLSFCYNKPSGYCEGHSSDANTNINGATNNTEYHAWKTALSVQLATDNIECSDIQMKQTCDCGPFPSCKWTNSSVTTGAFCGKINRTKTDDEMSSCKAKIGGTEIKFCEDSQITSAANCTWLVTNFNMPCSWDNSSNKCKFAFGSIFKDGPVGDLWEIDVSKGGESTCLAAKGLWNCEQYEKADGSIAQDCFCKPGTSEGGSSTETCNSFCGACEWYYPNGTAVSSSAQAAQACSLSELHYCQFTALSSASNGYGYCAPPKEMSGGGFGDCNNDCKSCGITSPNITKQQQHCEQSKAGCKWVNSSFGGYCDGKSKGGCDTKCQSCASAQDCDISTLQCEWDSTYNYCAPIGFNGEICFDGFDNDGDEDADCDDDDCKFDEFCGGAIFGNCAKHNNQTGCQASNTTFGNCTWMKDQWSNTFRCANPGEQCWTFETNQSGCAASTGCAWTNFTQTGDSFETFCDIKKTAMLGCSQLKNSTSCGGDSNCKWKDFGGGFGFCDFAIWGQCGELRNETACGANNNCTWSSEGFEFLDFGGGPSMGGGMGAMSLAGSFAGGHCEPACFNHSLNAANCSAKSFCEFREAICEPSFVTNCVRYDNNKTGCEAAPACQWYNSSGEQICDPKGASSVFGNVGFLGGPALGVGEMNGDFIKQFEFFHLGDENSGDWSNPNGYNGSAAHNQTMKAIDISYFGMKDLGNQLGFGIGVADTKDAAFCKGKPDHWPDDGTLNNTGKNSTKYAWYLDTDGNTNNNCNATAQNGSRVTGFEFLVTATSQWNNQTNQSSDTKIFYSCSNNSFSTSNVAVFVDKVIACQMVGGAGFAVQKEDLGNFKTLYNSSKPMRVFVSTSSGFNLSHIADSAGPSFYTSGSSDFKPECCACPGDVDMDGDGVSASSDTECTLFKSKGFVSNEDCFNNKDDNSDGNTDCADPFCKPFPKCGGTFNFAANGSDKTSPTVGFQKVDEYADGGFVKFDTTEPANGSLVFYHNSSSCGKVNKSFSDLGDLGSTFDDFKPFHGIMIDTNSLGYSLGLGKTYYYKTKVCDPSGNCGESACVNFTTKDSYKTVLFDIDLDSGYTADFRCGTYNKTNWNGSYAIKVNTSYSKNCNLTIKCNSGNYEMGLIGVDINQPKDIDLQGQLVCDTTNKMIGMDSANESWSSVLFDLGLGGSGDYILDNFPIAYNATNSIYHCDEDNVASCTNITSYANCTGNTTDTYCKIPTSMGYSGHQIVQPSGSSGGGSGGSSGGGGGGGGSSGSTTAVVAQTNVASVSEERVVTPTAPEASTSSGAESAASTAEQQSGSQAADQSAAGVELKEKSGEKESNIFGAAIGRIVSSFDYTEAWTALLVVAAVGLGAAFLVRRYRD